MRTVVITPVPRPVWDDLLAADPAALPDHTPQWLDAVCADGRYADASRLYALPDGRRFVLPLLRRRGITGAGGWWLGYPPGRGIGGLVGPDQDAAAVAAVLADLSHVERSGPRPLRLTIRPDPVRAAIWSAGLAMHHRRVGAVPRHAHVLDLADGADAVLARMPKSTRRGLRVAAAKGVEVRVGRGGDLLADHRRLHAASVVRWAGQSHEPLALARWRTTRRDPPALLESMARHLGEDFLVLVAYLDERPIASNVTVLGRTAHDTRAAIDRDLAGPVRAAELLQWHAIQLACAHGCTRHHLGESAPGSGLARFKERFGAVGLDYPEVRIDRLPISRVDTVVRAGVKAVLGFRDPG